MNVLIFSQHFYPEQFYINDIAKSLSLNGIKVDVITGKPNYPEGKIYNGYNYIGVNSSFWNNINIIRLPIIPRGKGNLLNLIINYLSFIISGTLFVPFYSMRKNYDIIFCYATSPFLQVIPALFFAKIKGAKLVVNVQDIWPESLIATGYIKNKFILKMLNAIIYFLYKNTNLLLLQSRAFDFYIKQVCPTSNTLYWPNSVSSSFLIPPESSFISIDELKNNKFRIIFTGNVGEAQSVKTILHLAICLKSYENIQILIFGKGSKWHWLNDEIIKNELFNIKLMGQYSIDQMPYIMRQASVLLVTLSNRDIFSATIPNKLQAYMASGRPIIAAINGEGARVINEARAGIAVPAENYIKLAEASIMLSNLSQDDLNQMGQCAQNYFINNFEHNFLISKLISYFNQLVE